MKPIVFPKLAVNKIAPPAFEVQPPADVSSRDEAMQRKASAMHQISAQDVYEFMEKMAADRPVPDLRGMSLKNLDVNKVKSSLKSRATAGTDFTSEEQEEIHQDGYNRMAEQQRASRQKSYAPTVGRPKSSVPSPDSGTHNYPEFERAYESAVTKPQTNAKTGKTDYNAPNWPQGW